jgi:uncharacterized DUF497 family protein
VWRKGGHLEISRIIWLEDIVEKLLWKHNVEEMEVIEVLENKPVFKYKEAGYQPGEHIYAAFGRTNTERLLSVFFVYTQDQRAIIVSARDMSQKERRKYAQ